MSKGIGFARIPAIALSIAIAGSAWANETGQLVGVVRDEATGKPLAGVRVAATSRTWIEQWVTTNREGQYVITLLPPGHYRITARSDGYVPASTEDVQVMIDYRIRNDLRLAPARADASAAAAGPLARK